MQSQKLLCMKDERRVACSSRCLNIPQTFQVALHMLQVDSLHLAGFAIYMACYRPSGLDPIENAINASTLGAIQCTLVAQISKAILKRVKGLECLSQFYSYVIYILTEAHATLRPHDS